jgi:hypothetical protein
MAGLRANTDSQSCGQSRRAVAADDPNTLASLTAQGVDMAGTRNAAGETPLQVSPNGCLNDALCPPCTSHGASIRHR